MPTPRQMLFLILVVMLVAILGVTGVAAMHDYDVRYAALRVKTR